MCGRDKTTKIGCSVCRVLIESQMYFELVLNGFLVNWSTIDLFSINMEQVGTHKKIESPFRPCKKGKG